LLTQLDLSYNRLGTMGAAALPALAQLSALRKLNLSYTGITFEGQELAALAACANLCALDLSHNSLSAGGVAALGQLSSLEALALCEALEDDHAVLPSLSRLSALTRLSFSDGMGYSVVGGAPASLSTLVSLRHLELGASVAPEAEVFEQLACLTALTALSLEVDFDLSVDALAALARISSLQRLRIGRDGYMYSQAALTLARMPALHYLNVKVHSLTMAHARELAHIPNLTHLVLTMGMSSHVFWRDELAELEAASGRSLLCNSTTMIRTTSEGLRAVFREAGTVQIVLGREDLASPRRCSGADAVGQTSAANRC
jgi:hypothetical protein